MSSFVLRSFTSLAKVILAEGLYFKFGVFTATGDIEFKSNVVDSYVSAGENYYYYKLDFTLDEIRDSYVHVESCQESVPQAITAFLESTSFEDAIRNAISLGGDADTLAAITGSIASAYWDIPMHIIDETVNRLDGFLLDAFLDFEEKFF